MALDTFHELLIGEALQLVRRELTLFALSKLQNH